MTCEGGLNMKIKKSIIQIGGGWAPNIGNAFIDLGSIYTLKQASHECNVYLLSTYPKSFLSRGCLSNTERLLDGKIFDKTKNLFDVRNFVKADYYVISGAILNNVWIKLGFFEKLINRNKDTKLIINGGGGSFYTEDEIETVGNFLSELNIYAFISRDGKAFKEYGDLAEHSFNGIDCGFFVSDFLHPPSMDLPSYITLTFDGIQEPKLPEEKRSIIRTHHSSWSQGGGVLKYIYYKTRQNFDKKSTLISDLPEDYLVIYANTDETHSDRIHACVPTLAYGKPARFYGKTPRKLKIEKERHMQFLSDVLKK